jgi:alginate O-acetyltransferase complex protein AlgI
MSFVSIEYLILFGAVLGLYYWMPHRAQNLLLLAASYVFYGWSDWRFLGLILLATVVAWVTALAADPSRVPRHEDGRRRAAMIIGVAASLAVLVVFKYFNFFIDSFVLLGRAVGLNLHPSTLQIMLPLGISFYTFQTLSYIIDVYRGQIRAARRLDDLALYVSLFTQLVAGPIERGRHLLPQIARPRNPTWDQVTSGAELVLWGVLKKLVIADNMAVIVNGIFMNPQLANNGAAVMVGAWAFTFQIYGDFSGYTDIARGCARMLGFQIVENFRQPYLVTNPRDFWRHWHISFSTWLRDYLYIPLGGNRHGRAATYRNVMITFLLGGLWHGASWTFVLWGTYHGLLLVGYDILVGRRRSRTEGVQEGGGPWRWLKVFLFFQVTALGWLIFRLQDFSSLTTSLGALASFDFSGFWTIPRVAVALLGTLALALPLMVFEIYQQRRGPEPWVGWSIPVRALFYLVVGYAIFLTSPAEVEPFIYFRF